jgi:phenylacetic acid degradation protein
MFYSFNGFTPVVHPSSFVHPQAVVTGNVIIGANVYIGPCAALRADWGQIIIHNGCNVQENCTIHMFPGVTTILEEGAHIGHGAVIHGAHIGANCLVGINAVIMDNVVLGAESIVGALSFLKADTVFEPRSLIVGNPAKVISQVTNQMLAWKTEGTKLYQALPQQLHATLQPCQALQTPPTNLPTQHAIYKTWGQTK